MLVDGTSWSYYTTESEFVKYFDRLKSTGMSFDEIESRLPQLEKYYYEMVVKGVFYIDIIPTLQNLFNNWKNN
jgi:hypothetical protein